MALNCRYIVVFKKDASQDTIDRQADGVNANGGSVKHKYYSMIMKGFSAEIPEVYLLALQSNLLQPDSPIAYIEPDSEFSIQGREGLNRI